MAGKIISLFNHKGGVGKTTLTHNIGYSLNQKGYNVLLVDADPQMNLSSAVFDGFSKEQDLYSPDDPWSDELLSKTTLSQYVQSYLDKDISESEVKPYQRQTNNGKKFHLLRGDLDFFDLESRINVDLLNYSNAKRSLTIMQRSIDELASKYDFVLIDCSPNASSIINAILLTVSNYFVCPVKPDYFSKQAIGNLEGIFKRWYSETLSRYFADQTQIGLRKNPKFAGLIVNDARRYVRNENNTISAHDNSATQLNLIAMAFVEFALGTGRALTVSEFKSAFELAEPYKISFVNSIANNIMSIAEEAHKCVYEMTQDDITNNFKNVGLSQSFSLNSDKNFKLFKQRIDEIADGFIKLK